MRGRLENALQRLPFKAVYVPPRHHSALHGIRFKDRFAYRWFYTLSRPLLPLLRALMPNNVLST